MEAKLLKNTYRQRKNGHKLFVVCDEHPAHFVVYTQTKYHNLYICQWHLIASRNKENHKKGNWKKENLSMEAKSLTNTDRQKKYRYQLCCI